MSASLENTNNYQVHLDNAIRLTSAINEMIAGKTIEEACQDADIKPAAMQGFFSLQIRNGEVRKPKIPDWKVDFIKEVYGEDYAVLSDFDEGYDYFKSTLTNEQVTALVGRFEKKMSYDALAGALGVSGPRVRRLIGEIEDLLHSENISEMFRLGGEYSNLVREINMAEFVHDQAIAKLKETLMKLDSETKGIEDSIEVANSLIGEAKEENEDNERDSESEDREHKLTLSDITITHIQLGYHPPLMIDARTVNVCRRCCIRNVQELYDAGEKKISKVRGAGKKVIDSCCRVLEFFGLSSEDWMAR